MLTLRSIENTFPLGDSIEVSPSGPLSVKMRQLFRSDNTIELGPLNGLPLKYFIIGVISIILSVTV